MNMNVRGHGQEVLFRNLTLKINVRRHGKVLFRNLTLKINVRRHGKEVLFRNLTLKINMLEIFYFSIMFHSFRQFDCSSSRFQS
jgi:hypothetical protein